MPYSLAELEERRNAIARRIAELGDLRAGSISSTAGRCGKALLSSQRPLRGLLGRSPRGSGGLTSTSRSRAPILSTPQPPGSSLCDARLIMFLHLSVEKDHIGNLLSGQN